MTDDRKRKTGGEVEGFGWLPALGQLVCAAKDRDASSADQTRSVNDAHNELFHTLRQQDRALAESRAEVAELREKAAALAADWDLRAKTVLRQARDADESELDGYHITAGALAGCGNELRAALSLEPTP